MMQVKNQTKQSSIPSIYPICQAEIVILQVLENIDKLENSSIDVSNKKRETKSELTSTISTYDSKTKTQHYEVTIEGKIIESIENKIREIESTGFKNKVSYKIRSGFIVDEL